MRIASVIPKWERVTREGKISIPKIDYNAKSSAVVFIDQCFFGFALAVASDRGKKTIVAIVRTLIFSS